MKEKQEIAKLLRDLEKEVSKEVGSKDPHGLDHAKRVLKLCMLIAEEEGGDMDIIVPAAMLHDIGRSDKGDHAKNSAKKASKILERLGYPRDKIDHIAKVIEEHSFSANRVPSSKEARSLSDADKLDALGAIGIARVFMTSAILNRGIKEALAHFHEKILKLPDRMYTSVGREIAKKRVKIVTEFVRKLEKELAEMEETDLLL